MFLAQLEAEADHFTIADSIRSITDKLVRRHPHVFGRDQGEAALDTAGQVRTRWEEIKAQERGAQKKPPTLLGGIPPTLPALLRAFQIGVRAASVGFDWTRAAEVVDKIQEEVDELREVVANGHPIDRDRAEEEMGDLLFTIANLARQLGIEPETALRKANDKFTRRFEAMAQSISSSGRAMNEMRLEEMEQEWQRAKALNHKGHREHEAHRPRRHEGTKHEDRARTRKPKTHITRQPLRSHAAVRHVEVDQQSRRSP